MKEKSLDLSVIIITKNEEKNIEKAINSARLAKEILVFDSESTDRTREIAESLGARVLVHPWTGNYSEQRNIAASKATYSWVMFIDADETISEALGKEVYDFFDKNLTDDYVACEVPMMDFVIGKFIKHGKWYPGYRVRLYRKDRGKWEGVLHEHVIYNGAKYTFKNPICHDSYKSIEIFIQKMNKYSSIDADFEYSQKNKFSYFKLFFQPLERFFSRYIIHKGYKDGFHGFICAFMIFLNYFFRHLKIWEKNYKNEKL